MLVVTAPMSCDRLNASEPGQTGMVDPSVRVIGCGPAGGGAVVGMCRSSPSWSAGAGGAPTAATNW